MGSTNDPHERNRRVNLQFYGSCWNHEHDLEEDEWPRKELETRLQIPQFARISGQSWVSTGFWEMQVTDSCVAGYCCVVSCSAEVIVTFVVQYQLLFPIIYMLFNVINHLKWLILNGLLPLIFEWYESLGWCDVSLKLCAKWIKSLFLHCLIEDWSLESFMNIEFKWSIETSCLFFASQWSAINTDDDLLLSCV